MKLMRMRWRAFQKSLGKPRPRPNVIKREQFAKWERRARWRQRWQVFKGYVAIGVICIVVAVAAWKLTGLWVR